MNRPMRLSATFVERVRDPGRYTDGPGSYGLSLHVKPSRAGLSKGWQQRLRTGGRFRYLGLGVYPLVTLTEAREAALENARAARAGRDLVAERRQSTGIPTFEQAADLAIIELAKTWRAGGRNAEQWRQRLRDYAFPTIGKLRVDTITSADVLACVMPLWAAQHVTAKRTLAYIQQVMAWAMGQGYVKENAAKGDAITGALPRVRHTVEHRKALHWRDLPGALRRIEETDALPTLKLAIRFVALTVARSGEVRRMRWDEVDGATWTVPGQRMKMGRDHRVPLSPEALDVLRQAQQWDDGSGLVFPNTRRAPFGESVLMVPVHETGGGWTIHGIRSTFKVWADEEGVDHRLSEFALGHVVGAASERAYARGDLYERRSAVMCEWAKVVTG